ARRECELLRRFEQVEVSAIEAARSGYGGPSGARPVVKYPAAWLACEPDTVTWRGGRGLPAMQRHEIEAAFDQKCAAGYDRQWSKLAPLRDALHLLVAAVLSDLRDDARVL